MQNITIYNDLLNKNSSNPMISFDILPFLQATKAAERTWRQADGVTGGN